MKKQASNGKLLTHFAIGFIIYQIIGNIVSSMIDVYFEENSYELFLKYGEEKVNLIYFFLTALVIQSFATILSTRSLRKHFEIRKEQKNSLVLLVAGFFFVIALITGALNSDKFTTIFGINLIVLLLLLCYVYIKLSRFAIDNTSYSNNEINVQQIQSDNNINTKSIFEQSIDNKETVVQNNNENVRFNPLTGTTEPVQQENIYGTPVQQPENTNYMNIFMNPTSNVLQNNEEQNVESQNNEQQNSDNLINKNQ